MLSCSAAERDVAKRHRPVAEGKTSDVVPPIGGSCLNVGPEKQKKQTTNLTVFVLVKLNPSCHVALRGVRLICRHTPLRSMISSGPPQQLAWAAALLNQIHPTERHAGPPQSLHFSFDYSLLVVVFSLLSPAPNAANVFHFNRFKGVFSFLETMQSELSATGSHVILFKGMSSSITSRCQSTL